MTCTTGMTLCLPNSFDSIPTDDHQWPLHGALLIVFGLGHMQKMMSTVCDVEANVSWVVLITASWVNLATHLDVPYDRMIHLKPSFFIRFQEVKCDIF